MIEIFKGSRLEWFVRHYGDSPQISYRDLDTEYYRIAQVLYDLGYLRLHVPEPEREPVPEWKKALRSRRPYEGWYFTWGMPLKIDRHTEEYDYDEVVAAGGDGGRNG